MAAQGRTPQIANVQAARRPVELQDDAGKEGPSGLGPAAGEFPAGEIAEDEIAADEAVADDAVAHIRDRRALRVRTNVTATPCIGNTISEVQDPCQLVSLPELAKLTKSPHV